MTYLLDSDMLIYFFNQAAPGYDLISSMLRRNEKVVISVLSVMEARAGWNQEEAGTFIPVLYDLFTIEPVSTAIAERAGRLRYESKHEGKTKPRPVDAMIAATALEHDYCLITNNLKDYTMPGLNLYRELTSDV
jgi:predicted nucleic acid-binding protein